MTAVLVVSVGCKLPNGFTIEYGTPGKDSYGFVNLNGPIGKRVYGTTDVPQAVWAAWLKKNAKLRYILDKSIFVV